MTTYVVMGSYGDYIGWFEHFCAGVYVDKDEAEKAAVRVEKEIEKNYSYSVTVEEHDLNESRGFRA